MNPIVELQRHGDLAVLVVDNPPVNTITAAARAAMFQVKQDLDSLLNDVV